MLIIVQVFGLMFSNYPWQTQSKILKNEYINVKLTQYTPKHFILIHYTLMAFQNTNLLTKLETKKLKIKSFLRFLKSKYK